MNFPFKIIDLTHTLTFNSPSWDLNCGFRIKNNIDYEDCTNDLEIKFKVQHISLPAGIGTHIDAPAHCKPDGDTIEKLDINTYHLLAQAYIIDISHKTNENYLLTPEDIIEFEQKYGQLTENSMVVIFTGWEKYWDDPIKYRNNLQFPSVSYKAGRLLLKRNIAALAIDTLSPDTQKSGFPIHKLFLSNNKYLIENIKNANQLPPVGSWILTLPLKISHASEAPARIIGLIPK